MNTLKSFAMKVITLFTMFILATVVSLSQQMNPPSSSIKEDYLKKSKKQKTTAKILLISGTVISTTGLLMTLGNLGGAFAPTPTEPKYDGKIADVLGYSGLVIAAGSIPFFIASSNNKKQVMSISFKNQMIPAVKNGNFVCHSIPSLQLNIKL